MPRSEKLSTQMRAESRSQLLEAARRVFARQGYFNSKISDITREAGMSQGNLYWYFKGKEDLLRAVLAEGFQAIQETTAQVASLDLPPVEKVDLLAARFKELYREKGNFTTILLSLMAHGGPAFIQGLGFDMLQIGARYHANVGLIFSQARQAGLTDQPPEDLVRFFFAFFNGLLITYGDEWQEIPLKSLQQAVRGMCGMHGN
jgi:AcrR family transcriptional regulator